MTLERDEPITAQWHAKQNAEPGLDLRSDFPFRARLVAAFYTTLQDLDGATAAELQTFVGLSARDSLVVFAALVIDLAKIMYQGNEMMFQGDSIMVQS